MSYRIRGERGVLDYTSLALRDLWRWIGMVGKGRRRRRRWKQMCIGVKPADGILDFGVKHKCRVWAKNGLLYFRGILCIWLFVHLPLQ